MPEFQIEYLEPKYMTIQAKGLKDAQWQARMMLAKRDDEVGNASTLVRIVTAETAAREAEEAAVNYSEQPA